MEAQKGIVKGVHMVLMLGAMLFGGTVCVLMQLKASDPLSTFFLMSDRQVPSIRGTSIRGKHNVQRFQSHLACFSESGRWEYNATPRHIPWNSVGDPFVNQCDERHLNTGGNVAFLEADLIVSQGGNWTVREELKWEWKTNSSCPMFPFNHNDLCKWIGSRRNMLVVGDSINHELQWVFLNNLAVNMSGKARSMAAIRSWEGEEVCGDVLGGPGFKVGWIRNDRLSPTLNISEDSFNNFYEWPWLPYLEDWNVSVLLLNRGAHFEGDEIFIRALSEIFSILQARYPDLLVIFRNTPPGHHQCTSYKEPIQERQCPADLPASWHWGEFQAQNVVAKRIVEEAGYIYMDVDSMLSLRPDGHIGVEDCLHYCLPGPFDSVVHLFYNIFFLLQ